MSKPDFWEGYVPEPVKPAQQEPKIDIYRSFEQWKSGNVLEHGVLRTEHYSEAQLDLVEMGWNYGYDAGRAVEQALDKKAENARELGLDYEPAQPVVWHDAPQTIYLQVCPEADHCEVRFADHDEVTWCQDKIHDSDIAYVRASTTQQPPAQQEPVAFLANGTRFKISYDSRQSGGQIHGIPPELGGRWVAFVAADDDCHLKLTSPPAQRKPLTDEAIATVYWGATGQSLRPQDNVLAHNFARSIEAAHGIKENT